MSKTVYRVKGIIRESDITAVFSAIPHIKTMRCEATFRDKSETKLLRHKRGTHHSRNFGMYRHLELRDSNQETMATAYEAIKPYFVRDFTHPGF